VSEVKPIRILLVDDHSLLRDALSRVLTAEPDFSVAGECASVEEALRIVTTTEVDMVLLDINLETEQGGTFLKRAGPAGYRGKILVVTAGVGEREAAWLLHRGCSGIFLKDAPVATLVQQIRAVMKGDAVLDATSVKAMVSLADSKGSQANLQLTARESRVLRHVCEGLANKEIAHRMDVSESSVKSFIQQLFTKTGVRSRAQLVAAAIEHYWDQLDQS
jgi:two-component system, NarL family, nitrate/nitrite response regulator NarL